MTFWVILSWVFVVLLTVVNVIVFMKLKQASEQMLKMAFPNAKNMNEALSQMQAMMGGMKGMGGMGAMGGMGGMKGMGGMGGMGNRAGAPMPAGGKNMDAQLKAAMNMLQNMQQKGGGKRR